MVATKLATVDFREAWQRLDLFLADLPQPSSKTQRQAVVAFHAAA
jgi:hypothetical protein